MNKRFPSLKGKLLTSPEFYLSLPARFAPILVHTFYIFTSKTIACQKTKNLGYIKQHKLVLISGSFRRTQGAHMLAKRSFLPEKGVSIYF